MKSQHLTNYNISNKKKGTRFEDHLVELLRGLGFWARPMYPAPDGSQPFDVMAVSPKGELFVFENKTNSGKNFSISRLEDNQLINLEYMNEILGKDRVWVVFEKKDGSIGMSRFNEIDLSQASAPTGTITFEEFVNDYNYLKRDKD